MKCSVGLDPQALFWLFTVEGIGPIPMEVNGIKPGVTAGWNLVCLNLACLCHPFFPVSGLLLFLTSLASQMHSFKCVMDRNCKIPSVSMGEICNPSAVQVTSDLMFIYLEMGHLVILPVLWICSSFFFFLQTITYAMYRLVVAMWFMCKLLSRSHV